MVAIVAKLTKGDDVYEEGATLVNQTRRFQSPQL